MRDLEKLVELGREFAKPWKRATHLLAALLVLSLVGLFCLAYKDGAISFEADYNAHSEVLQVQG